MTPRLLPYASWMNSDAFQGETDSVGKIRTLVLITLHLSCLSVFKKKY